VIVLLIGSARRLATRYVSHYTPAIERAYRRYKLVKAFGANEKNTFDAKIMVASHQRSGTHLAINTLLMNTNLYTYYSINEGESSWWDRKSQLYKTHLFPFALELDRYELIYYIYRNPFDVMLSFYRFLSNKDTAWRSDYVVNWNSVDEFCLAELPKIYVNRLPDKLRGQSLTFLDRWCCHLTEWERAREKYPEKIKFICFEDLKHDPSVILGPADQLDGISVTGSELPRLDHPSVQPNEGKTGQKEVIVDERVGEAVSKAKKQIYDHLF
jgi:hypothetical protein